MISFAFSFELTLDGFFHQLCKINKNQLMFKSLVSSSKVAGRFSYLQTEDRLVV